MVGNDGGHWVPRRGEDGVFISITARINRLSEPDVMNRNHEGAFTTKLLQIRQGGSRRSHYADRDVPMKGMAQRHDQGWRGAIPVKCSQAAVRTA